MPNWASNDLKITGKPDAINKFLIDQTGNANPPAEQFEARTECIEFDKIIPYPQKFKDMDEAARRAEAEGVAWDKRPKDGFNSGGYQWCIQNWGTKWPAGEATRFTASNGRISFTFDTAWSPPCPVIRKLAEMYPDLTFDLKYYEGGSAYKGQLKVRGQEVIEEWEGKYNGTRGG